MTCNQTIEGNHAISIKHWKTIVSDANPELLKKAQEELNEIPGQRERDIMLFREMVLGEKNLKSPIEDAFLLKFLRVRKFNVDRAFKLLKHYYSNRLKFPRMFSTYYCPSASLNFLNDHACIVLPYRDQLGRRIIVGRFGRWNPTLRCDDEVFASIHMCVEWALLEEETQVHGFVIIADMKHFGFTQLRYVTPSLARNFAGLLQGDLPARFKGFHIIFQSFFFELGFMILRPFLSKKIRSRISTVNMMWRNLALAFLLFSVVLTIVHADEGEGDKHSSEEGHADSHEKEGARIVRSPVMLGGKGGGGGGKGK